MFGPVSRRTYLSGLSVLLLALAALSGSGCKCLCTPQEQGGMQASVADDDPGSNGPPTVRGRARFFHPTSVQLDLRVTDNPPPYSYRIAVWWDGHNGVDPVYPFKPNAQFIRPATGTVWNIEGILDTLEPTDKYFSVKVIVYDNLDEDITPSNGKGATRKWNTSSVSPDYLVIEPPQ
ncbi:MAG: hypothetical protein HZA53_03930 [Planctomycetes bacterium]|nr:hypothetical protein [Planctomycetota bacterium]